MFIKEELEVAVVDGNHSFAQAELIDNGLARAVDDEIHIPFGNIKFIETTEFSEIGLPEFHPFQIKVDYSSSLGRPDFRYKVRYFNEDRSEVYPEQVGPFLRLGDQHFTLNNVHYDIIQACKDSNDYQLEDKNSGYYALPILQKLAKKGEVQLSEYLINEKVIVPEKLSVEPILDGEFIKVFPKIEGGNPELNDGFQKRFEKFNVNVNSPAQSIYTSEGENGERERVIFKPAVVKELTKIKALAKPKSETQFVNALEDPFLGLNPDIIDLELFGTRVKSIGVYVPNTKLVSRQFKTSWFPEVVFALPDGEDEIIDLSNEQIVNELDELVKSAKATEQKNIKFKGYWLAVEEAEEIVAFGRAQSENQKEPTLQAKFNRKVLIIEENIEDVGTEEKMAEFLDDIKARFVPSPRLKPEFKLMPHQIEGVAWLQTMFKDKGVPGVLLADDMGLGKTLQILSFIDWHCEWQVSKGESHPYLLVAPVALLENWKEEYQRFFIPHFTIHEYYGSNRRLIELEELSKKDLVLTSYETMVRDQLFLGKIDWSAVFLDEAQKIKSPSTLTTNTAKALKSGFKVALTGTPVENSLLDFWCLMDFVYPGLLGSAKEFKRVFKVGESDEFDAIGKQIRAKVQTLMLRRLKRDILKFLPNKYLIPSEWNGSSLHQLGGFMPARQENVYKTEINKKVRIKEQKGKLETHEMFELIRNLKSVCDHPELLFAIDASELEIPQLISDSAKLTKTIDIISEIHAKNEKVIIFTDRKAVQRLLQKVCKEEYGLKVSVINGETPSFEKEGKESRLNVLNKFQNKDGFNIIIMSPIAAGFGLNATGANHVVHFTRHWNPAKEDQATDRVYRIGQNKEVFVYYPMSLLSDIPTFDVKIHELLERKRGLSESTLFPSEKLEVTIDEMMEAMKIGSPF
jgi:SNF2 family DNA or RNA helicase